MKTLFKRLVFCIFIGVLEAALLTFSLHSNAATVMIGDVTIVGADATSGSAFGSAALSDGGARLAPVGLPTSAIATTSIIASSAAAERSAPRVTSSEARVTPPPSRPVSEPRPAPVSQPAPPKVAAAESAPPPVTRPSGVAAPSNGATNKAISSAPKNDQSSGDGYPVWNKAGARVLPETPKPGSGVLAASTAGAQKEAQAGATPPFEPNWQFDFTTGWQSAYFFRGLNVLDHISHDSRSGIMQSKMAYSYAPSPSETINLGVGYVESLDALTPQGETRATRPNTATNGEKPITRDNEKFHLPSREVYGEYSLFANYTRTLVPEWLAGGLGVNHYEFSNPQFWNTTSNLGHGVSGTTELTASVFLTKFQRFVTPYASLAWDVDAFPGEFLDLRLAFPQYKLWQKGDLALTLQPDVGVSYDFGYNQSGSGWNSADAQLSMRLRLNDNMSIKGSVGYVKNLSGSTGRANDGVFGAISFSIGLNSAQYKAGVLNGQGDVDSAMFLSNENQHWTVSAGVGWSQLGADFHGRSLVPVNALSLMSRQVGRGSLFQGSNQYYRDGFVNPTKPDGLFPAQATYSGGVRSGNEVRFDSTRYNYEVSTARLDPTASTHDRSMAPYLDVSYQFAKIGPLQMDVGFLYSYNHSDVDSGINLSSLSSGIEVATDYKSIYQIDPANSDRLITNGALYANGNITSGGTFAGGGAQYAGFGPQQTTLRQAFERVKLATFVGAKVAVDSHQIALPIGFKTDLGQRLHLGVSIAPTLALFNTRIHSEVAVQSLKNYADIQTRINKTQYNLLSVSGTGGGPGGGGGGGGFGGGGSGGTGTGGSGGGTASTAPANTQPAPPPPPPPSGAPSGGKAGSPYFTATLPGTTIESFAYDQNDVKLAFGIASQVSMMLDLDERRRWFIEFWTKYTWMSSITVENEVSSAKLSPSSLSYGIGVGHRF